MSKKELLKIGEYLENKKLAFCFLSSGELVSRQDCEKAGYIFKD